MSESENQHSVGRAPKSATTIKRPVLIVAVVVAVLLIAAAVVVFAVLPQMQGQPAQIEAPVFEAPADIPEVPVAKTYWPLTGLATAEGDEDKINNRVLSVKIENSPEARPQSGIQAADVVYETITEGGITRFNCMFQSNVPKEVGPVRSARNSDISIVPEYQGVLFYSGSNSKVSSQLKAAKIKRIPDNASLYRRVSGRYAPHNLYLNLTKATASVAKKYTATVKEPPSLQFAIPDDAASEQAVMAQQQLAQAAKDVKQLTVPFSSSYISKWKWDADGSAFLRSMNGVSKDALTKEQVKASNVVVLWANYKAAVGAKVGTLAVNLKGTGKVSVFTGGKRYDGKWKSDGKTPPTFKTADGQTIYLTPGNTWFQVIDTGEKVKVS